jgi:hypothetical protein
MGRTFAVARGRCRPPRAGGGTVEMLEAEAESLLRAGRVKVDAGDLAGRQADVIAGEPIVTVWLATLRKTSRRAELRLAVDKLDILYLNQSPQRHSEQPRLLTLTRAVVATTLERQECPAP